MGGLFILAIRISSTLLLLVAAKAFHSLWWKPKQLERLLKQQGIHGSHYKLLFGDMLQLRTSISEAWSKPMDLNHRILPRALHFYHHMFEKHGKVYLTWNGTTPRVITSDADIMKEVLSDKSRNFIKPPANPLIQLLTRGVSTLEGEEWALRRKLINPALHVEKLKGMISAFAISSAELIQTWKAMVGLEQSSCEVDVWPYLQNFTADVISRTAFGSSYEQGKQIFQLQKEQVKLVIEAARHPYIPGFRFVPTKKNKRRMYLDKEIKRLLRVVINRKEMALKMGEAKDDDLLGLLLRPNTSGDFQEKAHSTKNVELSIEDVIEECKLFYFAGQETTAVLLTWTLILLSIYQEWQTCARQEVVQVCGSSVPDYESIGHLKIVTMILHEVLRLYPPVVGLFRHTCKPTKVKGYLIPAGVDVQVQTIHIQHDEEYWGEDAQEFKPERFSGGVSRASKNQNAFFSFGWGPRICIGQNFAIMEAKMALAMILQNFSFELSPSYVHAPFTVITLQPQHGAPIILRRL